MVVRDPASLEVVGGKRKVRTDRTGARRMVRAPPAWDGGDRDAMSPVRVPSVAEEDRKRLPPRRERLLRERRRLANAVDGLAGLHGLLAGNPAKPGFRERPAGMETGYGGPLPPEPLAGIKGILDRLDLVCAEMKVAGAGKVEILEASGRALDSLHAEADGPPTASVPRRETPDPENATGEEGARRSGRSHMPAGRPQAGTDPAPGNAHHAAAPGRLRGTGPNDALLLGAGSPAGSCATGGSWPASRGWRRCPSRAATSTTARGSAGPAARCCAGTWCGWPGAG